LPLIYPGIHNHVNSTCCLYFISVSFTIKHIDTKKAAHQQPYLM